MQVAYLPDSRACALRSHTACSGGHGQFIGGMPPLLNEPRPTPTSTCFRSRSGPLPNGGVGSRHSRGRAGSVARIAVEEVGEGLGQAALLALRASSRHTRSAGLTAGGIGRRVRLPVH